MTVDWRGEGIMRIVRQAAMEAVYDGALSVEGEATRLIESGPKTGRVYQRNSVSHQASAPGEPPASDTGRLKQSSTVETDTADLSATVTWRTLYAAMLEFGTTRMLPRPFARVALANKRAAINDDIKNSIREALL